MIKEKHKLRQILLKFESELTTHEIILNYNKVLTETVLTHNLKNQSFLITYFMLNTCNLAHHNSYNIITTGGIKKVSLEILPIQIIAHYVTLIKIINLILLISIPMKYGI